MGINRNLHHMYRHSFMTHRLTLFLAICVLPLLLGHENKINGRTDRGAHLVLDLNIMYLNVSRRRRRKWIPRRRLKKRRKEATRWRTPSATSPSPHPRPAPVITPPLPSATKKASMTPTAQPPRRGSTSPTTPTARLSLGGGAVGGGGAGRKAGKPSVIGRLGRSNPKYKKP